MTARDYDDGYRQGHFDGEQDLLEYFTSLTARMAEPHHLENCQCLKREPVAEEKEENRIERRPETHCPKCDGADLYESTIVECGFLCRTCGYGFLDNRKMKK